MYKRKYYFVIAIVIAIIIVIVVVIVMSMSMSMAVSLSISLSLFFYVNNIYYKIALRAKRAHLQGLYCLQCLSHVTIEQNMHKGT